MLMRTVSVLSLLMLAACSGASGPGAEAGGSSDGSTSTGDATTGGTTPTTTATPTGAPTTDSDPSGPVDTGTAEGGDSCGDGKLDDGEVCDGSDLGGKQCGDLDAAYIGGALACAGDCGSFDASGCEVDPNMALVTLNEVTSKGALEGPYAGKGDAIELYNAGGAAADLSGWKLSDDPRFPADKTYVFPPGVTLAPGSFVVLVAFDEVAMTGDFPFGISDNKEETITLVDAGDGAIDQVIVDGAAAAGSYCRLPDGTGAWSVCDQTFGAANAAASVICGDQKIGEGEDCDGLELGGQTCEGLDLGFTGGELACSKDCTFDASSCVSGGTVAINELESTEDRIEIHNAGNQMIDISGWILTDDVVDQNYDPVADTEKLVFAPQTSLAAKQFLVVAKGMNAGEHPFGLGAGGDTVTLLKPNLDVVDQVAYAKDEATVSYCRLPDGPGGAWTVACMPTFGAANKGP